MAAQGNGALMDTLAVAISSRGSELRCQTGCRSILAEEGKVIGVEVNNSSGKVEKIETDIVLSNTGTNKTVELAGGETLFERSYVEPLHTNAADAPIMHVSFVMDKPLIEGFQGCMVFGNNKNLIYMEIPSEISPNMSPAGKYLHTAYGAPADAANPDLTEEFKTTLEELEKNFPGMTEQATFLVKAKLRGAAPGMHRWAGYGMPVNPPVKGLLNVGDGCAPAGTIGTESAAASAAAAVEMILQQRKVA